MGLLLDTHVLVWWLINSSRLSRAALDAIAAPANRAYVSAVAAWEIAIKVSLGKMPVAPNLASWLPMELQTNRFTTLPISLEHALAVEHLPRHHNDPFDRLLVAQAITEGLTLVTGDPVFVRYGIPLIRC
ncbi:MAG: type II toxin-antitoxin system VapC family toxin [Chloroflexota bacterium]